MLTNAEMDRIGLNRYGWDSVNAPSAEVLAGVFTDRKPEVRPVNVHPMNYFEEYYDTPYSVAHVPFLAVKSSNVSGIRYYNREMDVQFTNGWVYRYGDVPAKLFVHLVESPSKGQFFNTYVRGRYPRRMKYLDNLPSEMEVA